MISIIIPVYNAEKYIESTLMNLQNQCYMDFEVILINDGSTDNSGVICEECAKKDLRFKVIHQKNQGVAIARNRGLIEAKGEYITFVDADDELPENYLSELLNAQKQTDAEIVVCDVAVIEGGKLKIRFSHDYTLLEKNQALNLLLSRKCINSGPCAKLFVRDVVDKLQFPNLKVYEDILFVKDAFERANKIAITNRTEYRYIQNTNSAMHQVFRMPHGDIILATEELVKFIKSKKILSAECMYATLSHLFQYVCLVRNSSNESAKLFLEQARKLYRKYLMNLWKCSAFPWKEKIVFTLFAIRIK